MALGAFALEVLAMHLLRGTPREMCCGCMLDSDAGTLTVKKNGTLLGVMVAEGLPGGGSLLGDANAKHRMARLAAHQSEVLNPHYLLQDYGLRHGDTVFAVIAQK